MGKIIFTTLLLAACISAFPKGDSTNKKKMKD